MNSILKLFANNEFRFIAQTDAYRRKNYGDKSRDHRLAHRAKLEEELRGINRLLRSTDSPLIPVVDIRPDGRLVEEFLSRFNLEARRTALLDITKKSQRGVKKHQEWGRPHPKRNFTRNARHRILEAGAIIDRNFGKENTQMVTLTLPGSTPEAIAAVANWSGWIVNRMNQILRRAELEEKLMCFYVWELQKRGKLHMHWCIATDNIATTEKLAIAVKDKWFECLLELQSKIGVDCFRKNKSWTWRDKPHKWVSDIQTTKKSVAAYFSKYVSKEAKNQKRLNRWQQRKLHYPARWWGSNQAVKDAIKAWRYEYRIEGLTKKQCERLRELVWELLDWWEWTCKYQYEFTIKRKNIPWNLCSGKVQIAYGKPETWPGCHEAIKDLCESGVVKALADYVVKEADSDPANWQAIIPSKPRWITTSFASPITGELFKSPLEMSQQDIELATAKLEVENHDRYMQECGYKQLSNGLSKLSYDLGWADSSNPYLIAEQKLDVMVEYANSQMEYLQWVEQPFDKIIADMTYVQSICAIPKPDVCNKSPVSNKRNINAHPDNLKTNVQLSTGQLDKTG